MMSEETMAWVCEGKAKVAGLTPTEARCLSFYVNDGFKLVWQWFKDRHNLTSRQQEQQQQRRERLSDDDKELATVCCELEQLFSSPDASMPCNVPLTLYEGQGRCEQDLINAKPGEVYWRKRPSSVSWNLETAKEFLTNDGVLVVHVVFDPDLRALVTTFEEEDEILLEPDLLIHVDVLTKLRRDVAWDNSVRVLYVKTSKLKNTDSNPRMLSFDGYEG